MRRLLRGLPLLALFPLAASAQNFGNINPGTVIGNAGTTAKPAAPIPFDAVTQTISPMHHGAVGDGVADDRAAVQAAVDAAVAAGLPVLFDGLHKYKISSPGIVSTGSPTLLGMGGTQGVYTGTCTSGLIIDTNITALTLTGATARVEHLCIQMAAAPNTRTSGAAIRVGATATTQQGHAVVRGNTIINAYDGIVVGGPTTGTTQTNGTLIENNSINSPSHYGIGVGLVSGVLGAVTQGNPRSSGASTVGTMLRNNQVFCGGSTGVATTGVIIRDGAVSYDGGDGGSYNCNVGMLIEPGTGEGGGSQIAMGVFTGVIGDSSLTNDLMINTGSASGTAYYLRFNAAWFGTVGNATSVLLKNTGGGTITNVSFTGGTIIHGGLNQTVPIVDFQAGTNLQIDGSTLDAFGGPQTGPGIRVAAAASGVSITGNKFTATASATWPGKGIDLISGASWVNIENNAMPAPVTSVAFGGSNTRIAMTGNQFAGPVSGAPTPGGSNLSSIWSGNVGLDDQTQLITSAASVDPGAYNSIILDGTTTINTIAGCVEGRRIVIRPGTALTFGTSGNIPLGGAGVFGVPKVASCYGTSPGAIWILGG